MRRRLRTRNGERERLTGGGDFELLDAVGPDGREDYRHFVEFVCLKR